MLTTKLTDELYLNHIVNLVIGFFIISNVSFIGMLVYISLISKETNFDFKHKGNFDNLFVN